MLLESVSEINCLAPGEVKVLHLDRRAGGYHWPAIESIPFEFPQAQPDNESSVCLDDEIKHLRNAVDEQRAENGRLNRVVGDLLSRVNTLEIDRDRVNAVIAEAIEMTGGQS